MDDLDKSRIVALGADIEPRFALGCQQQERTARDEGRRLFVEMIEQFGGCDRAWFGDQLNESFE